jgi:arylsulfatase A-like enzyme
MLHDNGYATACVGKWHVGMTFIDKAEQQKLIIVPTKPSFYKLRRNWAS